MEALPGRFELAGHESTTQERPEFPTIPLVGRPHLQFPWCLGPLVVRGVEKKLGMGRDDLQEREPAVAIGG